MRLEGKCHCGNISYVFHWPGEGPTIPVRACQCSFCLKHGGVWTSNREGRIDAKVRDPSRVTRYRFGTKTADFHVCSACGVVPLVTCELDGRLYAVVNVNTFEGIDPANLVRSPVSSDGEGTDDRLARRKRYWIPEVTIA